MKGLSLTLQPPINASITLVAQWTEPLITSTNVTPNDVAAAVDYVNANHGVFTLVIDTDVSAAPQVLNLGGVKLLIIGLGEPREIRLNTQGILFIVGSNQQKGVNLTLEKNITFVGLTNGHHGAITNNNGHLVYVYLDGIFTMLEGAKVTGNTAHVSAVHIHEGIFVMQGGEIIENVSTGIGSSEVGGLRLGSNSSATLIGGRIARNNVILGDLVVGSTANLTLSGSAKIGTVAIASRPQDKCFHNNCFGMDKKRQCD